MSDDINIGSGIQGILAYSGGNKASHNIYMKQKNNNPQFTKLRVGEVVQGLVIEEPVNSIAEVRLPVGSYKAILHNQLIKGDKLFFKIEETIPTLVLKVYSVSLYKEKSKLVPEEILRILDLPQDSIFVDICTEYSNLKSQIIRDELLVSYRTLSLYSKEFTKGRFAVSDIWTSIFLTDWASEIDTDKYKLFNKYFANNTSYIVALNQIKADLNKFEISIQNELISYLNTNKNSSLPNRRLSVVV
ncbi:MAG TPA: hypothetical protein PLE30_05280 [Candidatus Kapabacteria bacterium]|nr:hypothetical protein [Candidatus Kapabacteria bacterium]